MQLRYSEEVRRAGILILLACGALPFRGLAAAPTFFHDVLPILQKRCQECHSPNQIGPMPLITYRDVRPWAKAIREAVQTRRMPPWFADPCCGKFSNDRSLTIVEIGTLAAWAEQGSPAGDANDQPSMNDVPRRITLRSPDVMLMMPHPFTVPGKGEIEYQRFVIPTNFGSDRWIQASEVRPTGGAAVHHVVVYIREPGEQWVKGPTKADILTIYALGSAPDAWPDGMAKLVKAGSDLIMEIHYTPTGKPVTDQTRLSLQFAANPPRKRVLTLQLNKTNLKIPPGEANYHTTVWGSIPNDALLLGLFPHMHLRGKAFEYDRIDESGRPEPLLRVNHYDFHAQLSYRLAQPILLKKGTRLSATAWYDNSANNPRNPDPTKEVHWGEQSSAEMLVGFFDVAVDPSVDKSAFFVRQ